MTYFVIYIILLFFSLFDFSDNEKFKKRKLTYFIFCSIIILLGAIRWRTGIDWPTYKNIFDSYYTYDGYMNSSAENGWNLINYWGRLLVGNFSGVIIIFAVLSVGIKCAFLYKVTDSLLFALFVFYCLGAGDITATRQVLSISFCMYSVLFLEKRNYLLFFVSIFIASSIHTSSWIFLLAFFIYRINWSVKSKIIILLISVVAYLVSFENFIVKLISETFYINIYAIDKLLTYTDLGKDDLMGMDLDKNTQIFLGLLKRAIIFPIIFYYENKISSTNIRYKYFSNLFTFGNIIYFLIGSFPALQRLATVFYLFEIPLIVYIFQFEKKNKIVLFCFFAIYCLAKLYMVLTVSWAFNVPYVTIFEPEILRPYK